MLVPFVAGLRTVVLTLLTGFYRDQVQTPTPERPA